MTTLFDPLTRRRTSRGAARGAAITVAALLLAGAVVAAPVVRVQAAPVAPNPTLRATLPVNYMQYNSGHAGAFAGHPGSYAWGAATLPNGNVIIGDIFNNRILEYGTSGNPVGGPNADGVLIKTSGVQGQGQNPYGLAVDPNDWTIYAGSAQCCGVQVWKTTDPNHNVYTFSGFIDPTGGPSSPTSRYPARLAVDRNGVVYVADMTLDTIAGFSSAASGNQKLPWQFGGYGSGPAQFKQPRGMALDASTPQRLYVIDSGNYRIEVFDTSQMGNTGVCSTCSGPHGYLYSFGSKGSGTSGFGGNLRGLAYDTQHNVLYAVDMGKQHVEEFSIDPTTLTGATDVWVRNIGKADPNLANIKGCPPCAAPGDFSDGGREDTVDGAGNLWVGDMPNFRAQVFYGEGATGTLRGKLVFDAPSATAGVRSATNAVTTAGSTTLSLADTSQTSFTSADVGQYVSITGDVPYGTIIASVQDATDATLSAAAAATGSGLTVQFGSPQLAAAGAFSYPEGVGVEPDGSVIVDDSHNFRLQWFGGSASGFPYQMQEGMRGRQNNYGLNYARNISVNTANGDFAVADTYNNAIHYYQENGTPLWQYGGNGTGTSTVATGRAGTSSVQSPITLPSGVGVDNSTGANAGDVYATDSGGKRIMVLSSSGTEIGTIVNGTNNGQQIAFRDPRGVAVDSGTGDVYVTDFSGKTLYHFTVSGSWSAGTAKVTLADIIKGNMATPFDVVVDPANGYIYVSDTSGVGSPDVAIFGIATQQFVSQFTITGQPEGIALAPNGDLFVASRSNDKVYDYCVVSC